MKIGKIWAVVLILTLLFTSSTKAQSTEVQQLLLNVEKLSQLKNILSDMKKGYTVISTGYNAVKNISKGNFSIHEVFLDGLMAVSPEVRKYRRVADIITAQKDIISEYKSAFKNFNTSGLFSPAELDYLAKLYGRLFSQSMDNLDELTIVITANSLRMNDAERLDAIDRIYLDTFDKLTFLRSFNRDAGKLLLQRKSAVADLKGVKELF
ncbi:TerB family tellurite resistance protein [Pedobacter sp. G11]|uniref:TerB family tellurite resistance protein n=1 Tax=Pedobacter sp. G11 TaxID=2482728 RepID=UPI000F5E620A|nr:TerB family tellurite resistance protein [Pedobacter sp. G11]AZI24097.1 TerB family tellurite resistance protein [Pedobacter sp. G11]